MTCYKSTRISLHCLIISIACVIVSHAPHLLCKRYFPKCIFLEKKLFKFYIILFLKVQMTINQHGFTYSCGADLATNHYNYDALHSSAGHNGLSWSLAVSPCFFNAPSRNMKNWTFGENDLINEISTDNITPLSNSRSWCNAAGAYIFRMVLFHSSGKENSSINQ